jgi:hypothetical protein
MQSTKMCMKTIEKDIYLVTDCYNRLYFLFPVSQNTFFQTYQYYLVKPSFYKNSGLYGIIYTRMRHLY